MVDRKSLLEETVASLRVMSRDLGLSFRSRARKVDLVDAILDALRDAKRPVADLVAPVEEGSIDSARVESESTPLPPGPCPAPETPPLPEDYGENRLTLMTRDPWLLFAYWEITPRSLKRAFRRAKDASAQLVLRLYEMASPFFTVRDILRRSDLFVGDRRVGDWYITVPAAKSVYVAEIGYLDTAGKYSVITRSNFAGSLPILTTESVLPEEIPTPVDSPQEKGSLPTGEPQPDHPSETASQGIASLTPRSDADVNRGGATATKEGEPCVPPAHEGGAEPAEHRWPTPINAGYRSAPAGKEAHSSVVVHAELVMYGRAEPGAEVSVMGIPVDVRPDGTFSVRFSLPDGRQEVTVVTRLASGEIRVAVTSLVVRSTGEPDPAER